MFSTYPELVAAMKNLTQEPLTTSEQAITLPMAEDEWKTRPNAESWGTITRVTEAGNLNGDSRKNDRSFAGSIDLFSYKRDGRGWISLIENTLTEYCGASWDMNSSGQYERDTGVFHWEWYFEVMN